jgi:adenylate kinase
MTLGELTRGLSTALGPNATHTVSKAAGLVLPGLAQADFDGLLLNLRFEPGIVKEFKLNWVASAGLLEALPEMITEYTRARNLLPLRVVLAGPPAVGKTFFAKQLCARYKLEHLAADAVIAAHVARLEVRCLFFFLRGRAYA